MASKLQPWLDKPLGFAGTVPKTIRLIADLHYDNSRAAEVACICRPHGIPLRILFLSTAKNHKWLSSLVANAIHLLHTKPQVAQNVGN